MKVIKLIQKSYDNKPTLFLIATPIGNMDDITYRAIEILKNVSIIFAEDTRITSLLLNRFNIKKKLVSSHQYNEKENVEKLLSYLNNNENVGLVTDRGTPIISDPGYYLVQAAVEHNFNVVSIPGATAFVSALITSNIEPLPFTFFGFLNSKSSKRKKELEILKNYNTTLIFYESPHRLIETLNDMLAVLGNRKCSISREITKKFETIYRGTLKDLIAEFDTIKGEFVIVVEGNKDVNQFASLSIIEHVNLYIKEGFDTKEAIKKVAKERQLSKNEVYSEYHKRGE